MNDETAPFTGWLDEFKGFLRDSYQKGLLFIPKITPRKVKKKTRWYKFTPQAIRRELARGLGDLYEAALKISKNEELTVTQRERWSRLSAHIAQTINVILNAYDEVAIEKAINDLKEYVRSREKTRRTQPQIFKMEYEAELIEEVDTWLPQDLLATVTIRIYQIIVTP